MKLSKLKRKIKELENENHRLKKENIKLYKKIKGDDTRMMRLEIDPKDLELSFPKLQYDDNIDNFVLNGEISCYTKTWTDDGSAIHISIVLAESLKEIERKEGKYIIGQVVLEDKYIPHGSSDPRAPKWMRVGHSERTLIIPIRREG